MGHLIRYLRNCILFVFCIVISGCDRNISGVEAIKVNPNEVAEETLLSEFVDSIRYIKLQTDPNCLMGRIRSIILKEKYIYAFDQSQMAIFVFDMNGKFVSKLDKQGNGPDEYRRLGMGFVDDNEEFVEFFTSDNSGSVLKRYANISFEAVGRVPMPMISANSCRRKDGVYYFATQQIDNTFNDELTNASILVVENGKAVKKLFDKKIDTGHSYYSYNNESFTENDNGELFVSLMFDNSFYKLENKEAYPVISIDFGKKGIDNSIGLKSISEQHQYLDKLSGQAYFPVLNVNNTGLMAFSYYYKPVGSERSELYQYIRFNGVGKTIHTKSFVNDITGFPQKVFLSSYYWGIAHEVWYKNYLVDIVQPGPLLMKNNQTKIDIEGVGTVTSDDNPLVMLMRLKSTI